MKIRYILFVIFLLSATLFPQELTFEDLEFLHKNREDIEKCETFLAKKNFFFLEVDSFGDVNFAFNKAAYSDDAKAFLSIEQRGIRLQSIARTTFEYYKNILKQKNFTLDDTLAKDGILVYYYSKDDIYFKIEQQKSNYGNTVYILKYYKW